MLPILILVTLVNLSESRTNAPTSSGTTVYESDNFLLITIPFALMTCTIGGLVGYMYCKTSGLDPVPQNESSYFD